MGQSQRKSSIPESRTCGSRRGLRSKELLLLHTSFTFLCSSILLFFAIFFILIIAYNCIKIGGRIVIKAEEVVMSLTMLLKGYPELRKIIFATK
jgi:hypothetical protein